MIEHDLKLLTLRNIMIIRIGRTAEGNHRQGTGSSFQSKTGILDAYGAHKLRPIDALGRRLRLDCLTGVVKECGSNMTIPG